MKLRTEEEKSGFRIEDTEKEKRRVRTENTEGTEEEKRRFRTENTEGPEKEKKKGSHGEHRGHGER